MVFYMLFVKVHRVYIRCAVDIIGVLRKVFYMIFPMLCYKIRIDYMDGNFWACNIVYDVFYTAFYRCILSGILHFI